MHKQKLQKIIEMFTIHGLRSLMFKKVQMILSPLL